MDRRVVSTPPGITWAAPNILNRISWVESGSKRGSRRILSTAQNKNTTASGNRAREFRKGDQRFQKQANKGEFSELEIGEEKKSQVRRKLNREKQTEDRKSGIKSRKASDTSINKSRNRKNSQAENSFAWNEEKDAVLSDKINQIEKRSPSRSNSYSMINLPGYNNNSQLMNLSKPKTYYIKLNPYFSDEQKELSSASAADFYLENNERALDEERPLSLNKSSMITKLSQSKSPFIHHDLFQADELVPLERKLALGSFSQVIFDDQVPSNHRPFTQRPFRRSANNARYSTVRNAKKLFETSSQYHELGDAHVSPKQTQSEVTKIVYDLDFSPERINDDEVGLVRSDIKKVGEDFSGTENSASLIKDVSHESARNDLNKVPGLRTGTLADFYQGLRVNSNGVITRRNSRSLDSFVPFQSHQNWNSIIRSRRHDTHVSTPTNIDARLIQRAKEEMTEKVLAVAGKRKTSYSPSQKFWSENDAAEHKIAIRSSDHGAPVKDELSHNPPDDPNIKIEEGTGGRTQTSHNKANVSYAQSTPYKQKLLKNSKRSRVVKTGELHLHRVQLSDSALYRCRVDMKASPTRNAQVMLHVIGEYT